MLMPTFIQKHIFPPLTALFPALMALFLAGFLVLLVASGAAKAQTGAFTPLQAQALDDTGVLYLDDGASISTSFEARQSTQAQAAQTRQNADIVAKMTEIDEVLRLLSRRLEAMPLPGSRPLQADENQQALLSRLGAIELQLESINQARLTEKNQTSKSNVDEQGVADLRVRLAQIEEILRGLNGQVSDMSFHLTKLSARFEQVAADTEFRFQEMEMTARQGRLSDTNAAALSGEPQVLGTLRVSKPSIISQNADGDNVALVGEASRKGDVLTIAPRRGVAVAQEGLPNLPNPRIIYDEALTKLRNGKIDEAQEQLSFFITNYKKHELLGNAQYWLGETYYVRRDYKTAAQAFLAGYTNYAQSPKAPDSLLKLGMTLIILGEQKTGCDAFAELAAQFPNARQSVIQRADIERQRANCL